jgi:hypothetical protein
LGYIIPLRMATATERNIAREGYGGIARPVERDGIEERGGLRPAFF